MSDTTGATGAPSTTDTTTTTTASTGGAAVEDVKSLPDWAQKLVGDLRRESGAHRTAKVSAESALEALQGKFAEQETATKQVTDKLGATELGLVKLKAALAAKQTGDQALVFAERLQGSTADEIAADAAKLAAFFGAPNSTTPAAPKPDPSQGQGGSSMGLSDDPLEQSLRLALGL